ncbi:MAG: hypothetical protein HY926_12180 [Elusimicrobia bacterium]|nr:hypothetical protein [Elusimicrobiota bacterium]
MRRGGRPTVAAFLIIALVQSTGAADLAFLAPVRAPVVLTVPPGRAAFPMKPAAGPRVALPDGGLWGALRDALAPAVYACDAWLAPPASPEFRPIDVAAAAPAPDLPDQVAASPEPVQDRMLIDHHDFDMVAFGQEARDWRGSMPPTHQVVAPVLQGPWRKSHGLRYRINYLRPEGFFELSREGIYVTDGSREMRVVRRVALGPEYLRTYALYHEGDLVDYEIELVNETGWDLEGLLAFTNQEGFDLRGRIGRLLGRVQLAASGPVSAGQRVVLRGQARLAGFEAAGSNFEQTHLTVEVEDSRTGRRRLVDDPQAGILDPPRAR